MEYTVASDQLFVNYSPEKSGLMNSDTLECAQIRSKLHELFQQNSLQEFQKTWSQQIVDIFQVTDRMRENRGNVPVNLQLTYAAVIHQIMHGDEEELIQLANQIKEEGCINLGALMAHDALWEQHKIDEALECKALDHARSYLAADVEMNPVYETYARRVICASSDDEQEVREQLEIGKTKYTEQEQWRQYWRAMQSGNAHFVLQLIDDRLNAAEIVSTNNEGRKILMLRMKLRSYDLILQELKAATGGYENNFETELIMAQTIEEMEGVFDVIREFPIEKKQTAWSMVHLISSYLRVEATEKAAYLMEDLQPLAQELGNEEIIERMNMLQRIVNES